MCNRQGQVPNLERLTVAAESTPLSTIFPSDQ